MLESMSWVSYCEWYRFYLLEPFGDAKDDWYQSQMLFASMKNSFPEADITLSDNCRYTELHVATEAPSDEPISDEDLKRKMKMMGR